MQVECMCGTRSPSRPHLVWSCPQTEGLRWGIIRPDNRAQERLFAAPLVQYPAAPESREYHSFLTALSLHLASLAGSEEDVIVATDGSSEKGVGACAVATTHKAFADSV